MQGDNAVLSFSEAQAFTLAMGNVQGAIYANAIAHGWWSKTEPRNSGEAIALMHSELSEALEAMRKGDGKELSEKEALAQEGISCVEEELADAIIRILDYAEGFALDIGKAIIAKHNYNLSRPYRHGKTF